MNMREAAEQADALLDQTLEAVHPGVRWEHGQVSDSACTGGGMDEGAEKGAVLRRRAVSTVISDERRGSFLGVVERHWKERGYRVTSVNSDKKLPAVYVETSEGFSLSLSFGYRGQAFFEAASPCADRSEVPPPGARPGVPDYTGRKPPLPDEHSDFWSDRAPVPGKG
ncbi:hypothetical protein D7M15_21495 [Streptomyces sp. Z26]|nr:hypothetical protein D7M15_21495 [Streptomyces sp. Z26]